MKKLVSMNARGKDWHSEQRAHHLNDSQKVLSQAWDDITVAELDAKEVRKARMTEIGYARHKRV